MKNTETAGIDGNPCPQKQKRQLCIVAEIGTSHNGEADRTAALVKAAAEAGADCLKTQIVFADEIIHPETGEVSLPGGQIRLYDRFLSLEQGFGFYEKLKQLTEQAGMEFLATPFGPRSLDWMLKLGCDSIKIASPELNHFPLLRKAAEAEKQMVLSTGVSMLNDIEAALDAIGEVSSDVRRNVVLLHCVTAYPAPENEYNLRLLPALSDRFGVSVGVSDHSMDPELVPVVATALGASFIEKHITLKNEDGGLDDLIALTPSRFRQMTNAVRETEDVLRKEGRKTALSVLADKYGSGRIESVLGDGVKRLAASEAASYGRTNRSIHALYHLSEGTVLTTDNTALLRTEKKLRPGLGPEFYDSILGKRLIRAVESGQGITSSDID